MRRVESKARNDNLALVTQLRTGQCQREPRRELCERLKTRHTEFVTFLRNSDILVRTDICRKDGSYVRDSSHEEEEIRLGVLQAFDESVSSQTGRRAAQNSMSGYTHWLRLNVLFSRPAWLIFIRSTAMMRSLGVRNHAVCGELGKKNLRKGKTSRGHSQSGTHQGWESNKKNSPVED